MHKTATSRVRVTHAFFASNIKSVLTVNETFTTCLQLYAFADEIRSDFVYEYRLRFDRKFRFKFFTRCCSIFCDLLMKVHGTWCFEVVVILLVKSLTLVENQTRKILVGEYSFEIKPYGITVNRHSKSYFISQTRISRRSWRGAWRESNWNAAPSSTARHRKKMSGIS